MSARIPGVWYRDDPSDGASEHLLSSRGVTLSARSGTDTASTASVGSAYLLEVEHVFDCDVTYVCDDGEAVVDVRDSADAFVRVLLSPSRAMTVAAGTYRVVGAKGARTVHMPDFGPAPDAASRQTTRVYRAPAAQITTFGTVRVLTAFGATVPVISYRFVPGSPEAAAADVPHFERPGTPHIRSVVVDLCESFYGLGWVTGTGGSISIRHGDRIFMAPSSVQKERMQAQDMFVLDTRGQQLYTPAPLPGKRQLNLSQCAPLFQHAFNLRNAGACIHTHDISAVMVTLQSELEFRITHQEMIKGIAGHGFVDECVVPIIENTPHECDLADSLEEAMTRYPRSSAILVRRHGVYVWGASWEAAKTQAECYHYLFNAAVRMREIGVDPALVPRRLEHGIGAVRSYGSGKEGLGGSKPAVSATVTTVAHVHSGDCGCGGGDGFHGAQGANALAVAPGSVTGAHHTHAALVDVDAVVLDIEGTTTSLAFVTDVLFPYAAEHVSAYLTSGLASVEVQEDVAALVAQSVADVGANVEGAAAVFLPADTVSRMQAGDASVVGVIVANVRWQMALNRKTGALKALQGHIWRHGYSSGALKGHVFPDTPLALDAWVKRGVRVYIYSSGSREAQRLLFAHSEHGDLRGKLCGYFDTRVGPKVEAASYRDIVLTLGVDAPTRVLFATDALSEARAAAEAGLKVVITQRPGNLELPADHGFPVYTSLMQLVA